MSIILFTCFCDLYMYRIYPKYIYGNRFVVARNGHCTYNILIKLTMKRSSKPTAAASVASPNGLRFLLTGTEGKYRSIVENSIHAFFLTLGDGSILEINNAACRMFGYTPAELKKLKRWDFIDHNDPQLLAALELREKNGFAMTEATGIRKDGERFPVEIASAFFIDTDGIRKTSTTVTDITERRKIKQAIEESEQRYRMFVQQSSEGIWRIDLDKAIPTDTPLEEMIDYCYHNARVAECNDNFARMYGSEKAADVIGMPLSQVLPESNPCNMHYLLKFFTNGFKVVDEISYETDKEGNQLVFLNNMIGIVENDHLKRAWGTQRNITKQKQAEMALAESENKLSTIISAMPECVKLVDRNGTILQINPLGLQMAEADNMTDVVGKNVLAFTTPEYHEGLLQILSDVFNGQEGKMVYRIKGLKGGSIWAETHCVPFRNAANEITALLAVTRDITEKIKLENSLNEERKIRHKQITRAVINGQEKERLQLGQELHDNINQVLASAKLYLERALKDEKPRPDLVAEGKTLLDYAMAEIRKLSKTLLPPSLNDKGLQPALEELAAHIRQVNDLCIRIEWNGVNENEFSGDLKLTVFRIVQEQLNNIIKHAEAKEAVIAFHRRDEALFLSIKDNGVGFDTSQKKNGVGLRNICSRAELNNGYASVHSEPGEGCELLVCFPHSQK